jgi:hypothetical protein
MNLLWLIPWTMYGAANEIIMGEHEDPIVAERIELTDHRDPLMAIPVRDWVRLKRRAESALGYCDSSISAAVKSAHEQCLVEISQAVSMQEQSTADSQKMIAALQLSLDLKREELQAAKTTTETMTWVSIGVGAVALTSTLLWVTK